jgi:hypothetical protein
LWVCVFERKTVYVCLCICAHMLSCAIPTYSHIHTQPLIDELACDANDCAEDIGAECVAHANRTYYCDCSAVVPDIDNPDLVAGGETCDDVIDSKVYKCI